MNLNSKKINFSDEADYNYVYDTIINADNRIKAITLHDFSYETYVVYAEKIENEQSGIEELQIKELRIDNNPKSINEEKNYWENFDENENTKALWDSFRKDVFVKSVLSGTTALYEDANKYSLSLNQQDAAEITNVSTISTNTDILLKRKDTSDAS